VPTLEQGTFVNASAGDRFPSGLSSGTTPFSAAVTCTGEILYWGGWLGDEIPKLDPGEGYASVSCGNCHFLAITTLGRLVAWGAESWDQCKVPALYTSETFVAASACHCYSTALTSTGRALVWGGNEPPELGGGLFPTLPGVETVARIANFFKSVASGKPPALNRNETFTAISAGWAGVGAVTSAGRALVWARPGDDPGASPSIASMDPVQGSIASISAGTNGFAAVTSAGEVHFSMVGSSPAAPALPPGEAYIAVSCGQDHHLLLTSAGRSSPSRTAAMTSQTARTSASGTCPSCLLARAS